MEGLRRATQNAAEQRLLEREASVNGVSNGLAATDRASMECYQP